MVNDGQTKVIDFGFAQDKKSPNPSKQSSCGTPYYIAPEIILNQQLTGKLSQVTLFNSTDYKSDVWSFGVLYFRVLTGKFPFRSVDMDETEVYQKILKKQVAIPFSVGKEDRELICRSLERNPERRISLKSLILLLEKLS